MWIGCPRGARISGTGEPPLSLYPIPPFAHGHTDTNEHIHARTRAHNTRTHAYTRTHSLAQSTLHGVECRSTDRYVYIVHCTLYTG